MAALCKYHIAVAVILSAITALSSQQAQQYCHTTAYQAQPYTAYHTQRTYYTTSCGFWGWQRCRRSRYFRQAYTAYRQQSYSTCCSGYETSSCHALCWGSTSCSNDGSCTAINTCTCRTGWTGSRCTTDVNECSSRTDRCHSHATCHNTPGSYTCSCNSGYTGNGFTCTNINECLNNNGGCHHNCHDSDGSYTCSCNDGYTGSGLYCTNINECLSNNGGCHQNCDDSDGSYTCSCNNGYQLNSDGRTCETPPPPPTSLQVSSVGNRTAILTWQAPVVPFLNSLTAVSSYQVIATQEQFANVSDIYVDVDANTTTYMFPQILEEYTVYTCTVKARNSFGLGSASQPVTVRTHQAAPSGPPQSISAVALGPRMIHISWSQPLPVEQNGVIRSYIVNTTNVETGQHIQLTTNDTTITVEGLHPYYNYHISAAAITIEMGPYTDVYSLQTPQDIPGASVQNFTVEVTSATRVQLSWLPPDPQLWNGVITNYTVVYELLGPVGMTSDNSSHTVMTKTIPTQDSPLANNADPRDVSFPLHWERVAIEGLYEHHVYKFSVFIANAVGRSGMTMTIIQGLPGAEPSGAPNDIQIHILSSTSIEVRWLPPDFLDQNGVITGYTVILTNMESNSSHEYNTSGNVTIQHIEDLLMYTSYYVRIAALTGHGRGPFSNPTQFWTYENIPSPVKNVSVELNNSGANVVVITWLPPDEPIGVIIQYQVFYAGYNGTQLIDGPHSVPNLQTLKHVIPGLIYGLTYQFKVRASTNVGYGNYSSSMSIVVHTPITATPSTGSQTVNGSSTYATGNATYSTGNTTDVQPHDYSTGAQTAVSVVAGIGWILLLGVVLVVVLVFYRYKKRRNKLKVSPERVQYSNLVNDSDNPPENEQHPPNYDDCVYGNAKKTADTDFLDDGATTKLSAADQGNSCITVSTECKGGQDESAKVSD